MLNGIDPILIATGNDWRAVEAGVHAYAARSGRYQPVTDWRMEGTRSRRPYRSADGGRAPWAASRACIPPRAWRSRCWASAKAEDLARICAAVGLVQNLGALKALATVGIVKGHMQLHAANLAIAAGAEVHEIPEVRKRLAEVLRVEKHINLSHAREILEAIRVAGHAGTTIN